MRYLILYVIIAFLCATNAQAEDKDFDHNEFCIQMADLAGSVMKLRQVNIPIIETVKLIRNGAKDTEWLEDILMTYTKQAYEMPLRLSDDAKTIEINEFTTKTFLHCLEVYE